MQPNKAQEVLLNRHFGSVRWVYNYFLKKRIEQYRAHNASENYSKQASSLPLLKRKEETAWLKEVNSQSLQVALQHLDTAFVNFFCGKTKFPRFKNKKMKNSFAVPQYVSVEADRLYLPKFKEGIKLKLHRKIEGVVKHCTISKTPSGKYFVAILCEVQYNPVKPAGKTCGIDLGLKDFAVTSDGVRFQNHHHLQTYLRQLKRAQQHLGRKNKGSNNRNKQQLKVARIYEMVTNTRMDLLHKISKQITNAYDIIAVEDLNVKGLLRNRKLGRHIADASWGTFVSLLQYKAKWNNKQVVKVGRFYPSSKTCHECGHVHQNLKLSERQWICPNGHILDRDLNAAKNILREGVRLLSSGTGDYTCRDQVRPSSKAQVGEARNPIVLS
jgi:putative transposase